jgi:hypothetical protein
MSISYTFVFQKSHIQMYGVIIYVRFIVNGETWRVGSKMSGPVLTYNHNIRLQESRKRTPSKNFLSYFLETSNTQEVYYPHYKSLLHVSTPLGHLQGEEFRYTRVALIQQSENVPWTSHSTVSRCLLTECEANGTFSLYCITLPVNGVRSQWHILTLLYHAASQRTAKSMAHSHSTV